MKKYISIIILFFTTFLFSACKKENTQLSNGDYLIFGHFYGMCEGERCVETYKIADQKLYEDSTDNYMGQNLQFHEMTQLQYSSVQDLETFIPNQLLSNTNSVIGCPDCADGGGLFIQYKKNGIVKTWRIDQMKNNVPTYLHTFMDKVNEKIELLQ